MIGGNCIGSWREVRKDGFDPPIFRNRYVKMGESALMGGESRCAIIERKPHHTVAVAVLRFVYLNTEVCGCSRSQNEHRQAWSKQQKKENASHTTNRGKGISRQRASARLAAFSRTASINASTPRSRMTLMYSERRAASSLIVPLRKTSIIPHPSSDFRRR